MVVVNLSKKSDLCSFCSNTAIILIRPDRGFGNPNEEIKMCEGHAALAAIEIQTIISTDIAKEVVNK